MKSKKERIIKEIIEWVLRFCGVFLIICYSFFYRLPINIADENILYRLGWFAENLVILLVLYKITTFGIKKEKTKK